MKDYEIKTTCPFCKKTQIITVREFDYHSWQAGELIQEAFPYLSADERETLMSGICSKCWDNIFKYEER